MCLVLSPRESTSVAPSSEDIADACTADLQNVLPYAAMLLGVGMVVEVASHLIVFNPVFLPIPLLALTVMASYLVRHRREPTTRPGTWAVAMAASVLLGTLQHLHGGAYLSSAFVVTMAVLVSAASIMPIVPALLTVGASWALLVLDFHLLGLAAVTSVPMSLLVLIAAALLYASRRRAIVEGKRASMLERLLAEREAQAEHQRRQAEFVETLGGGLSHNLANRLQVLAMAADAASHPATSDHSSHNIHRDAHRAAERARSLVRKLQTYTGMQVTPRETVAVEAFCEDLAAKVPSGVAVSCSAKGSLSVDRAMLIEALLELVSNAITATEVPTQVVVDVSSAQGFVAFHVRDEGRGFDASMLSRAMDPFATSDPAVREGLGMSFAQGAAVQHGGDLAITRSGPAGSTVRMRLPLLQPTTFAGA